MKFIYSSFQSDYIRQTINESVMWINYMKMSFVILFLLSWCSFSQIMELRKVTDLVPAAQTKQQLHQKLLSHSEAKLESIDISLFCPLTHSRIVTPVRGKKCRHVHCFDGEAFCNLMWEKDVAKWKCPVSSTYQNNPHGIQAVPTKTLGSLRYHDGDGYENVT